jgi:hypothetical protein
MADIINMIMEIILVSLLVLYMSTNIFHKIYLKYILRKSYNNLVDISLDTIKSMNFNSYNSLYEAKILAKLYIWDKCYDYIRYTYDTSYNDEPYILSYILSNILEDNNIESIMDSKYKYSKEV